MEKWKSRNEKWICNIRETVNENKKYIMLRNVGNIDSF